MKLIIDIPYGLKDVYEHGNVTALDVEEMKRALQNGTPIPDNATNGDIVQMMFPNANVYEHNGGATYSVNNEYNFNATWWNSQYQKGGKE